MKVSKLEEVVGAEAKYLGRQRPFQMALIIFAICGLLRFPFISQHIDVAAPISLVLFVVSSAAVVLLGLWAFRCPLCGGGIKLGGHVCSKCGHDFKKGQRNS
jgi:hypothetical protein